MAGNDLLRYSAAHGEKPEFVLKHFVATIKDISVAFLFIFYVLVTSKLCPNLSEGTRLGSSRLHRVVVK